MRLPFNRFGTALCAVGFVLITMSQYGCKKDADIVESVSANVGSTQCVACHTNYELLKKVYSPDTTAAVGGCGGEAVHIEPYDRVYMGGSGYEVFKNTTHGQKECTFCHGGNGTTSDKALAHKDNFVRHPSTNPDKNCVVCHPNAMHSGTSIHQGLGQKKMVYSRFGASSFEALPQQLKDGYDHHCAQCHGGCGDCHVNRPQSGGGGLLKGHKFSKTPDMIDQCVTCHVSRGGHAFLGVATGTVPDVHKTKLNATCLTCHTGAELHGDGTKYEQRYSVKSLPTCVQCHSTIAASNTYHAVHMTTLNCNACHSQDYNNCGSCHIGGVGVRVASHQKFKLALNPLPQSRPYKIVTVRQSLMAPDSWKEYGVPLLANFDVFPTYKYTTPHNILRWTTRTQVAAGKSCYDNCHVIKEGTKFRNLELYLMKSNLEPWEINADKNIIMDGKFPAGWQVQ